MAKKKKKKRNEDFHPEWYPEVEVFCEGELIFVIGSTQDVYDIDMWSGIHPFFTGSQKLIDTEGRVDLFCEKYGLNREATKKAVSKRIKKIEEKEEIDEMLEEEIEEILEEMKKEIENQNDLET
jgi:large subunit ribosomal protein L31